MEKNIIESLDNINKLIEEGKYQEAKNYIKKTKAEMSNKNNPSSYIDDLIDNLK